MIVKFLVLKIDICLRGKNSKGLSKQQNVDASMINRSVCYIPRCLIMYYNILPMPMYYYVFVFFTLRDDCIYYDAVIGWKQWNIYTSDSSSPVSAKDESAKLQFWRGVEQWWQFSPLRGSFKNEGLSYKSI